MIFVARRKTSSSDVRFCKMWVRFFSRRVDGAWTRVMDRCTGLGAGVAATVDRSLIRGLDTDRTMGSSRGCLALSTSMGLKPLQDEDEGSPDLRPAPRLVHRRCVRWCLGSPVLRIFCQPWSWRGLWSCGYRACDIHQIHRPDAASALAQRIGGGGVGDGPDEAERLAGDRRHRHRRQLAARDELAVARHSGDGGPCRRWRAPPPAGGRPPPSAAWPVGHSVQAASISAVRARLLPVLVSRPRRTALAGRVLADDHAEIAHQLARIGEAARIADLGDDRGRVDQPIAAQHLQRLDQPGQRPVRHQLGDVIAQTVAPRCRLVERRRAARQPAADAPAAANDRLPQPSPVLLRPGLAGIARCPGATGSRRGVGGSGSDLPPAPPRARTRSRIASCAASGTHTAVSSSARSSLRQRQAVAPVGLHPYARTARRQRRRHHLAAHSRLAVQPAIEAVAARPRLVAHHQLAPVLLQPLDARARTPPVVRDLAPVAHLALRQRLRHRDVDAASCLYPDPT